MLRRPITANPRGALFPLLGAAVLAASALLAVPLAQAAPAPVASRIIVTAVGSPSVAVPRTPGAPVSFVALGTDFRVDVELWGDVNGVATQLPASYNKTTALNVRVSQGDTSLVANATTTVVVPAGATSARFDGLRYTQAANGVRLQVDGPSPKGKTPTLTPGASATMNVQSAFVTTGSDSKLTSIGAGSGEGLSCSPTPSQPVCADLVLPNGSIGGQLLSLGLCDGSATDTACPTSRPVVQALADVSTYTPSAPATLVVKCDKDECGGGGIKDQKLVGSLSGDGPLTEIDACPAKGTVGELQSFCVDYVQSSRDNAGDTFLYLLFVVDARATFK